MCYYNYRNTTKEVNIIIDIFQELEAYNSDPEVYELIMHGTPEQLFPKEIGKLDNWLDSVESK